MCEAGSGWWWGDSFTRSVVSPQQTDIKLEDDDIDALIDELDEDGDGEIDYEELVRGKEEVIGQKRDSVSGCSHCRE